LKSFLLWGVLLCFSLGAQDWIDPYPRPPENEDTAEKDRTENKKDRGSDRPARNSTDNPPDERVCRRPPPRWNEEDGQRPPPPRPPDREELFKRLDANGDGVITKEEFMKNMPPPPPPFPALSQEEFFKLLDRDGDAFLSLEEFRKAPRPPPPPGIRADQLPEPAEMFERLDVDGDGKLSVAEFKRGHLPAPPVHGAGRQQKPAKPNQTQEKDKEDF
jgi:hypothetical protein